MGSVKLKDLKAFVRYDGSGRVVSGSLVFRKKKPKNGRWGEITKNLCCNPGSNPSSTTTTTTQGGGGVTPTAFIKPYWLTVEDSCTMDPQGTLLFYSASSVLQTGSFIFYDAALTNPVMGPVINVDPFVYPRLQALSGGFLGTNILCPFTLGTSYSSAFGACANVETYNFYTDGSIPSSGVTLYFNQRLTITADNIPYLSYNNSLFSTDGNGMMTYNESCASITTTTTTTIPEYTIGQQALGGVIAYINGGGSTGTSGLVALGFNLPFFAEWGCQGTLITGADGTAIGTGNQNTIDILAECSTPNIAARVCGDLIEGGYNDWYLPSKDELNALYTNRVAIGGFENSIYWSSTELDNNNAWYQNFTFGTQDPTNKGNELYVRAVRSF